MVLQTIFTAGSEPPRRPHEDRPWVMANMISSVDGAVSVDGRSGGLGNAEDKRQFVAHRDLADVILVGASTARVEQYHLPKANPEKRAARKERGLWEVPRLAVVSGSLTFDPPPPFLAEAEDCESDRRPIFLTSLQGSTERVQSLQKMGDVIAVGESEFDIAAALSELRELGATTVLCEGGPSLLGQLAAAELVDELFITIAPMIVGGSSGRIVRSVDAMKKRLSLAEASEDEGYLFLRYLAKR